MYLIKAAVKHKHLLKPLVALTAFCLSIWALPMAWAQNTQPATAAPSPFSSVRATVVPKEAPKPPTQPVSLATPPPVQAATVNAAEVVATPAAVTSAPAPAQAPTTQPQQPQQPAPTAVADPANAPRLLIGNDATTAPVKPIEPFAGAPTGFKFEEAPIAEFATLVLKDVAKVNYVLHQPLSGFVSLSTNADVSPDQAMFMLESALQANGLVMARDARGTYHVGRVEAVRSIVPALREATAGTPLPPGNGAIIVKLNYIGASEMASILRPVAQPDSIIRVDSVRNLLVLNGNRTQAEGWLELINTFDVNLLKGMSVGVFPLKYASVAEVEAALSILSGGDGASAGTSAGASAGQPAAGKPAGAASNSAAASGVSAGLNTGAFRIMPMARLNSILVVTPRAAYLDEARRWIDKLDQPSGNSAEPQLFIYQVQNVNAQHLAGVLSGIFGDGKSAAQQNVSNGVAPSLGTASGGSFGQSNSTMGNGNSPFGSSNTSSFGSGLSGGFGSNNAGANASRLGQTSSFASQGQGQPQAAAATTLGSIRVMADTLNNSVLVWSTRAEYEKIEATLKRLDLPLTQVLIEASIVEVTLSDGLEYGLQWAFADSRANTGYTGQGALVNTNGGVLSANAALAGFSYTLKNPAGNVRAVLNALSKTTSVKVLASPSLMVLDNHKATIAVGNQIPVEVGGTITSDGGLVSTQVQYKDTGVNLTVLPSVNSGNVVTMQVEQSVTDVGASTTTSNQPNFLQRQISSKLAVRSGESIVMGGLIQGNSTTSKSGVPFLHKIPLFGNLFGTTDNSGGRTELLVVITPRVVRTDIDIREATEDLRNRMRSLEALRYMANGQPDPATSQPVFKPDNQ